MISLRTAGISFLVVVSSRPQQGTGVQDHADYTLHDSHYTLHRKLVQQQVDEDGIESRPYNVASVEVTAEATMKRRKDHNKNDHDHDDADKKKPGVNMNYLPPSLQREEKTNYFSSGAHHDDSHTARGEDDDVTRTTHPSTTLLEEKKRISLHDHLDQENNEDEDDAVPPPGTADPTKKDKDALRNSDVLNKAVARAEGKDSFTPSQTTTTSTENNKDKKLTPQERHPHLFSPPEHLVSKKENKEPPEQVVEERKQEDLYSQILEQIQKIRKIVEDKNRRLIDKRNEQHVAAQKQEETEHADVMRLLLKVLQIYGARLENGDYDQHMADTGNEIMKYVMGAMSDMPKKAS